MSCAPAEDDRRHPVRLLRLGRRKRVGFGGGDGGQVSPMDREEQLERFGEAVERKKEQSKEASEATGPQHSGGSPVEGDQPDLVQQGPQDVRDERSKSSGHGQKTADKWNQ
jgi:hypothetical protein